MEWPSLPYASWNDTLDTLHMWMQIVGKVKLVLSPFLNQWWEVAYILTPRGMTTGRIPYKGKAFSIDFDFISHTVSFITSTGEEIHVPLRPMSVAQFYEVCMKALEALHIKVSINPVPSEFQNPIPFQKDTKHMSYEKAPVEKWWRMQLSIALLFDTFRSDFRGKSSPIQFFWGSFDLNGTRFSGKPAAPPALKGSLGKIMKFAENEENFAFGFWPGDKKFPHPAFYTYMYPAPKGYKTIKTGPSIAYFNKKLSEYILPYEKVRKTKNPEKEILSFLTSTYHEYTKLAGWNIKALEERAPKVS